MTDVRPERADDLAGIRDVLLAAFETPAEAELVDRLRVSDHWVPELSVVAVEDGRVVAHSLLSLLTLTTAGGDVPALALGPVAVLPELQKRGLGGAVVRDGLARRNDRLVVVLGDPAYYGRFGFEAGAAYGITGAYMSFGDAWQVLPPSTGTPPGEVLYPHEWDDV